MTTFKAKQDIAAGQEIFIQYSDAQWFERRNIPYADVDYASTMWRPDRHPLPCRQSVSKDGRHRFFVRKAVPSGTVLEVSLCLEVPVLAVEQFPFLRDFVLTCKIEDESTLFYNRLLHPHAHMPPVFCADRGQTNIGELAEKVLYLFSPHTHTLSLSLSQPMPIPALIQSLF